MARALRTSTYSNTKIVKIKIGDQKSPIFAVGTLFCYVNNAVVGGWQGMSDACIGYSTWHRPRPTGRNITKKSLSNN